MTRCGFFPIAFIFVRLGVGIKGRFTAVIIAVVIPSLGLKCAKIHRHTLVGGTVIHWTLRPHNTLHSAFKMNGLFHCLF